MDQPNVNAKASTREWRSPGPRLRLSRTSCPGQTQAWAGVAPFARGRFCIHIRLIHGTPDLLSHDTNRWALHFLQRGRPDGCADRIEALIVQDAVAHNEGLGANWKTRRAFWADRAANETALRTNLLSLATTRTRHVGNDPNVERYDPDLWTDEFAFLNQPRQVDIQSDLFYDYRTNVAAYPTWQAWMRETRPRLLVLWGKYDLSFELSEPEAYRRDVPQAEVHVLEAGHFALDTAADQIAQLVRGFMK